MTNTKVYLPTAGEHVSLLDWTFLSSSEVVETRGNYQLSNDFTPFARDGQGDLLARKDGEILSVDHEEILSSDEEKLSTLCEDGEPFWTFLQKRHGLPEISPNESAVALRAVKKSLVELRKCAPPFFEEYISDAIDDLRELLSDLKFYRSAEGKRYLITLRVRKELNSALEIPARYQGVDIDRQFQGSEIFVRGWCSAKDESLAEVKEAVARVQCELPVRLDVYLTYDEYHAARNAEIEGKS